jgi:signal transduction histidine kinase
VVYTTAVSRRAVEDLARSSLERTARSLVWSAESVLTRDQGPIPLAEIFSDMVVAYGLVADGEGRILFHSNPGLAGEVLREPGLDALLRRGTDRVRTVRLGTGLDGFEYTAVSRAAPGGPRLIRVVLHAAPTEAVVRGVGRAGLTAAVVLAMLWLAGGVLAVALVRLSRQEEEDERRRRLALVGQMTAQLAHEIRNTLASLKGYAQWLGGKVGEDDPRREAVRVVLLGAERLERMVDELLRYAREEEYRLRPVETGALVRAAAEHLPQWRDRMALDGVERLWVRADEEKAVRVLVNGLGNAFQAMGDQGEVTVTAALRGRMVEITLADRGPGLPEADAERLFTPFFTTRADGTGLGLAYSRKVVEGMGGRITLRNRGDGPGAVLSLSLPAARGAA